MSCLRCAYVPIYSNQRQQNGESRPGFVGNPGGLRAVSLNNAQRKRGRPSFCLFYCWRQEGFFNSWRRMGGLTESILRHISRRLADFVENLPQRKQAEKDAAPVRQELEQFRERYSFFKDMDTIFQAELIDWLKTRVERLLLGDGLPTQLFSGFLMLGTRSYRFLQSRSM